MGRESVGDESLRPVQNEPVRLFLRLAPHAVNSTGLVYAAFYFYYNINSINNNSNIAPDYQYHRLQNGC